MASFSSYETGALGRVSGRREQQAPDPRKVPPVVDNLAVNELNLASQDGGIPATFVVDFQPPRWWGQLAYDVWVKNTTQADPNFFHVARINGPGQHLAHPYVTAPDTYDVVVVALGGNGQGLPPEDLTPVALTMTGLGPEVPDVLTFDVSPECCELLFEWTYNAAPSISHFEIRQGTDFATGSHVISVGPAERTSVVVSPGTLPLALTGVGLDFHIKALTRVRAASATEISDTLTAAELACIESFCCTKVREILLTGGSDTIVVTSMTPGVPGVPPIINVGPRNTGGGGRTIDGSPVGTSFTPNGDVYDYTIQLDDVAIAGEYIVVTEGVRLH